MRPVAGDELEPNLVARASRPCRRKCIRLARGRGRVEDRAQGPHLDGACKGRGRGGCTLFAPCAHHIGGCPFEALNPPSTGKFTPVTKRASSLAKNAMAPAMSEGWAPRPSGMRSLNFFINSALPSMSLVMLVWVKLGQTECGFLK